MENTTQSNDVTPKMDKNIKDNLDTIAFYLLEAIQKKLDYQPQKRGA